MADDAASSWMLRFDYIFSRLLRLGRLPGHNKMRQVRLGGAWVSYRLNRGDLQSLREVLVDEVYACELPWTPQTVLDLGANIGLTSLWLHQRHGGKAGGGFQLVAVEAAAENALIARANLEANQVPAEVINAAAGLVSGQAWFETRTESNLGRMLPYEAPDTVPVPVAGIRELLERFPQGRVDLVKMDIEGGEEALLGHDTSWLAVVQALMVEWHDDRADSRPLIQNVQAAGFQHRRINCQRQGNLSLFVRHGSAFH
jgi:FkbM family methyltransferase